MSLLGKPSRRQSVIKTKSKSVECPKQDLASFRRKRTIAFKRLAKALEIGIQASSDQSQRDLFFSYHSELKNIASNFEHANYSILDAATDSDEDENNLQEQFDEMYFKVLTIHRQLSKCEVTTHLQNNCSSSNIRLPKIVLPSFSGNIKQWPEYFDTFNALIHNSTSLMETEKFHYLTSSLSGDALAVVKPFPLAHEHYRNAYQALAARYHNKRDLAFTCWRDILNVNFRCNDPNVFRKSIDSIDENLCILKTVNLPIDKWDFVLVYHILSKLDTDLRRSFEEKYSNIDIPTYEHLRGFLQSKCEAFMRDSHFLENNKASKFPLKLTPAPSKQYKRNDVTHTLVAATDNLHSAKILKCSFCNNAHSITLCSEFLNKPIDERLKIVTEKNWCYNCLKPSHQLKNCKSVFSCRICKRKHHSLLHREKQDTTPASSLVSRSPAHTTVLLATAIVQVKDASGSMQSFRALFDTGSQSNFITENAINQLNLSFTKTAACVSGLGDVNASIIGDVTCSIGTNNRVAFNLDLHVLTKICGDQPIAKLNTSGWSHIKSLPLADPGFDIPGPIDILLAADVFADPLLSQHIKGSVQQPTALNSVFGWLLLGKTRLASNALFTSDNSLNSLVQQFWELDSIPQASSLTPDESSCENKFVTQHYRDSSGRYVVSLPFKDDSEPIFEGSRDVALRRFHAIERRLTRDPELHSQYTEFMQDYIASGHMSLVSIDDMGKGKYYIPHHCVLRPDSTTTRLRVVFDASAKDYHSRSLNDSQLIGPKLQTNIFSILLRFREHSIVFMADVRQMYRQVLIDKPHREYQRILWRVHPYEPLQEYRLNTVTYGVASSPFLACRTLRQLAADEGRDHPIASRIIMSDLYVDDVVSGCNSLDEAQKAQSELITLFSLGHFKLRKWVSNHPQLLSGIPEEDRLKGSVSLDSSEPATLKVLGLKWDPAEDAFLFEVKPSDRPCTKRAILIEIARIFDPLGFVTPITIQAKCLIQKLWILGVGWDETPSSEVISVWNKYRNQLSQLQHIRIPRSLTCANAKSYQLHGFCDSSEIAYGAVIYLRVTDAVGNIQVFLVCSKARVAPLKRTTLPRLELCAAVLLADLYKFVRNTYLSRIPIESVYLWSDSTIVLSWLRSHSSRWATFVANRVSHVQSLTPVECWHHVCSGDNPADICSRGQFPCEIANNSLWWAGPCWLSQCRESWPSFVGILTDAEEVIIDSEKRKSTALVSTPINENQDTVFSNLLNRHSSLSNIINIVTYIRRFINNSQNPAEANRNPFLNNVERHQALLQIVKFVQSESFSEESLKLKSKQSLSKPFRKLNPFIDDQEVIRVGGRISRSGLGYEQKHPALLPAEHPLTFLIIDNIHRSYCHPGINTTHYLLLQQFWIISAKRIIRCRLSKCLQCFRLNPKPLQPFMSDLPSYRINEVKPFSIVGVDFGGPFRIKLGSHRGAKMDKAYLCLFVCLATKAVHLEVVSSLSTEAFIAALRRFVARRGRCSVIHADCGTNFVGASNQLSAFMQQATRSERIEFKFNPPSAPHFGGVWEIQIKAAKSHLYRVVGDQVLTFEELTTLFVQIEAILNSRPLCPASSDPNDFSALTPGHFLTLEPLASVPDEDLAKANISRLHRWQVLQSFQQHFWSRWKREYLNSLTQRAKWTKDPKPLPVGSMVIIRDDNRTPLHWTVGRVISLHPGADGVARIAVVKTAKNQVIQRPLVKLCPLPIEA